MGETQIKEVVKEVVPENIKSDLENLKNRLQQEQFQSKQNEYKEHDALTLAQVKELKKAQHAKTSEITKILCPRLGESRKRGEQYLVEWNKVNKGLWSIFKTNVNGVSIPYDRTPKNKFKQSLEYVKNLTVADYLAYRDERWEDIRNFDFVEPLEDDLMTIEKVLNDKNDDDNDDGSPTSMLMH